MPVNVLKKTETNRWLFGLVAFLWAFIPLYPKIPLFTPIENYIVRIRLEDVFVFFAVVFGVVQVLKKKMEWKVPGWRWVFFYLSVGLISVLSSLLLIKTIPWHSVHILKSLLHWLRYAEYFVLLFLTYGVVNSKKRVRMLLGLLGIIVLVTSVYGWGQRYWRWPVYSTMNREYSAGVRLMLDSVYARVPSTFAGHYDYGAFLVVVLALIVGWWLGERKKEWKVGLLGVIAVGMWGLVVSASRSSFIGFGVGVGVIVGLRALDESSWKKSLISVVSYGGILYGLLAIIMLVFGHNIRALLVDTLSAYPQFAWLEKESVVIDQYTNPVPANPENKPPDVYVDYLEKVEIITINEKGETVVEVVEREPQFSKCAQQKGLSLCIRLDALWPQAWKGFWRNPFLGSGYGTLNKRNVYHLAEADSTDNNFLRILGETGALGFVSYFGIVATMVWYLAKSYRHLDRWERSLVLGYGGGFVGLLINALYIDVFAASKVAFIFWGVTGLVLGVVNRYVPRRLG